MTRDLLLCTAYASLLAPPTDSHPPEWVQLFPAGAFTAVDGRSFQLKDPQAVIAASLAHLPAPIDYDHGAERPADASLNSRAAGWMTELAAREGGLWAKVDWTPNGGKAVADREYRFLSPSFMHSKGNGVVTSIIRAALTNTPAFRGLIQALASQQQENVLDLKALAAALGLPETATMQDCLSAIASLRTGQTTLAAQIKSVATAAGLTGATIGDTEVTAICAKLKTPAASGDLTAALASATARIDSLQTQIVEMRGATAARDAAGEVDKAIAAGKITPAERDWALDYAAREPAKFQTLIGVRPVILRDGRVAPAGGDAEQALSDDEKAICASLGLKEDEFKKELAAQRKAKGGA